MKNLIKNIISFFCKKPEKIAGESFEQKLPKEEVPIIGELAEYDFLVQKGVKLEVLSSKIVQQPQKEEKAFYTTYKATPFSPQVMDRVTRKVVTLGGKIFIVLERERALTEVVSCGWTERLTSNTNDPSWYEIVYKPLGKFEEPVVENTIRYLSQLEEDELRYFKKII